MEQNPVIALLSVFKSSIRCRIHCKVNRRKQLWLKTTSSSFILIYRYYLRCIHGIGNVIQLSLSPNHHTRGNMSHTHTYTHMQTHCTGSDGTADLSYHNIQIIFLHCPYMQLLYYSDGVCHRPRSRVYAAVSLQRLGGSGADCPSGVPHLQPPCSFFYTATRRLLLCFLLNFFPHLA